jgi:hypothetical protein
MGWVILSSFYVWLIVSGVGFFPVQFVHSGCRVLLIVSGVGTVFSVQWVLCFLLILIYLLCWVNITLLLFSSTVGAVFC